MHFLVQERGDMKPWLGYVKYYMLAGALILFWKQRHWVFYCAGR